MLKIHFLLRQPKKKGRKAIYATVRYQCQTAILYPSLCVHSNDWISKFGISKPKDIPENSDLKDNIYDYEKLIRQTHIELQRLTPGVKVPAELLKKAVYAKKLTAEVSAAVKVEKDKPVLITDFFQTMIDDSTSGKRKSQEGKQLTAATISTYETTKKHIEDYQTKHRKKYYLSGIDQKLIDGFSDYLTHHLKMAFNGSGKYMKTFRTMMNYARQLKMIGADVLIDNKVKVTHESPDNIYLTEKDIADLYAIKEFDSPTQKIVLELFIIGCLTGLRFSDYSTLSKARFNNGFMFLTQQKTQNRVTIPIHSTVQEILTKYPGGLPKCPPNQVFNRYLKDLGKKLPQLDTDFEKVLTRGGVADPKTYKKYDLLQSHTARRSFATNEYLNGTPTITIMAITGHRTEKSFLAYIKADSLQHSQKFCNR
jgi:hypothetical protein